jgi:hypothetical protein
LPTGTEGLKLIQLNLPRNRLPVLIDALEDAACDDAHQSPFPPAELPFWRFATDPPGFATDSGLATKPMTRLTVGYTPPDRGWPRLGTSWENPDGRR